MFCVFALQIYHYNDMTFEQAASHKLTYIYRIFGPEVANRVWHLVSSGVVESLLFFGVMHPVAFDCERQELFWECVCIQITGKAN